MGTLWQDKGDCSDCVHSDQKVLVMVKQEAEPHERWPRMLKGDMENNSTKPSDLVAKLHSDSLKRVQQTLSQGKKKKGNEVADDTDDDDVVRNSVSRNRVTVTLCTAELFLSR
jgi:hypothetical protein